MIFRWLSFPLRYGFSKLKRKLGKLGLARMEIFLAFGNENEVFVKGRVVEAYKQSRPSDKKNAFQNILASLRRYAGSSIPDVSILLKYRDLYFEMVSNEEGIFEKRFLVDIPNEGKEAFIELTLLDQEGISTEKNYMEVPVSFIESGCPHGVISDIDDTVIISHATEIGKKLWLSISKNAYTRRPFPGVSEFYKLLTEGGKYPIFYVSSSDWNLFDLINDFLKYRNIPAGPLLLKDPHVNLSNIWKSGGGNHDHKLEKISFLMSIFSNMTFTLVGDSGQHDPELYAEVIEKFPGRVKAVYIRKVKQVDGNREEVLNQYHPDITVAWVHNSEEAMALAKTYL